MSLIGDTLNSMGLLGGIRVIQSPHLTKSVWKQTKWPRRHKSKWRVVKKFFLKYYKELTLPSDEAFLVGSNTIVVHPAVYQALRKKLNGGLA